MNFKYLGEITETRSMAPFHFLVPMETSLYAPSFWLKVETTV